MQVRGYCDYSMTTAQGGHGDPEVLTLNIDIILEWILENF